MSARLPPPNDILLATLRARLALLDAQAASAAFAALPPLLQLTEFDDFRYSLSAPAPESPARLELSLALPSDPTGERGAAALPSGALEAVAAAFSSFASVAKQPTPGFALTLQLDLARLPSAPQEREAALERAAALRATVQCAPLAALLRSLASGASGDASLFSICHRPGEAFYAKRSDAEAVTVVLPLRFADSTDVSIAKTFLAQFAEARRAPAFSTAPFCSYSPTAPLELKEVPAEALAGANGGFVSFVLFRRHVADEARVAACAWAMCTFYAFVAMHIKCSKAYMHSSMRRRAASLLAVLNRAKPEPLVAREKKTASGRTFKVKE
jgi:actin related protein 2/3 complex subunit 2